MDKDKKQEELDRLYRLLQKRDAEFEKAKGKRAMITMAVFSFLYFVVIMLFSGHKDIVSIIEAIIKAIINVDIQAIAAVLIPSIALGWMHFWANATIFGQLSQKSREENKVLDIIKKRIREIEKGTPNYNDWRDN